MSVSRIELSNVSSLDDFYGQIASQISMPSHFGNNLDALYDALTTDLVGPLAIVWHRHDNSATRLGYEDYTALLSVLRDAAAKRPDIELTLD